MNYTERLSQERLQPSRGHDLGRFLLDQYAQQHQRGVEDGKWKMFAEIITRIANDVAGNRYTLASDGSRFSSFDRIFEHLRTQGEAQLIQEPEKTMAGMLSGVFHRVLDALSNFTKGIVQTPHPTEVLTRDAIYAEGALHTLLENNHSFLFSEAGRQSARVDSYRDVLQAMDTLYESLKPLREQMRPEHEMARSVEFSETMFNSVPLVMQTMLDSAIREHVYDPSQKLTFAELSRFNLMIQPETWSPGDRDSKDQMTAAMLEKGVALNEQSMKLHYIRKLAELTVEAHEVPVPSGEETIADITKQMMYRLMVGMADTEIHDYARLLLKLSPDVNIRDIALLLGVKHPGDERDIADVAADPKMAGIVEAIAAKPVMADTVREVIRVLNQIKHDHKRGFKSEAESDPEKIETPYAGEREFLDDLNYLHSIQGDTFQKYILPNGEKAHFDKLEALMVQANNFGLRALRSQIRQNADVHEQVMGLVLKTLHDSHIEVAGYDPEDPKSAMKKGVVEAALDMLMSKEHPEIGRAIHAVLKAKITSIGKDLKNHVGEKSDEYRLYETLKGFQIAAEKPDAIPRYLIAECRDETDVLAAFFMLKAMEPDAKRHDVNQKKVEIVPLFEHRKDVNNAPETVIRAYDNTHFREHHNAMTDAHDPAILKVESLDKHGMLTIDHPDPLGLGKSQLRELTQEHYISVAEAKRRYGIAHITEADEKKQVKATKLVMYAGSDITKSAGSSGAGLVMRTTNVMREKLLDMDEPVLLLDYTGVGGGVHRSQPVSTSYETAQGRSLRQTPQSIAQKILQQAGRAVQRVLGMDVAPIHYHADQDDRKQKVLTAQLNMGNIGSVSWNEDAWNSETNRRLNASIDAYEKLYQDPAYSTYFGFTADNFVKLTSYGARGAARNRAAGDTGGFPPHIDVKELRAIGYGAALNASGSCAGLFFGASQFLELDDNGHISDDNMAALKKIYLNDPIAQDRINRATYGVVMANMDTAWTYLGYERRRENGQTVLSRNGISMDARELMDSDGELEGALAKLGRKEPLNLEEKTRIAAHTLATIELEYQRLSTGLLELHRAIKQDAGLALSPSRGTQAEQLMEELPLALKEQMKDSKWHMTPAREKLAKMFDDIVKGHRKQPDRSSPDFTDIYYAMGSMFETFENVPRAYTRMRWAIDNELGKSQSASLKA